ncbi:MAG: UDP-glucose 4-epimerase GalE [Sedimentibacter saalensis]|uniref:UDP-glucose 4-epimerase GalE n=1 Tax=Sedimentibacter saalensis TaxID=130788 RepID=UPI002B20D22B|nr:UDP-glucose 4-epimerase GalE [Sedimentibacter saalensis]MEA5093480.1 UDP-glucose 4-epimerase GalE [Sedimentibacter saalensis]
MILITGGTGYIGSHTAVKLIEQNEDIIILDNLYNSKSEVIDSIETITGKRPKFYQTDLLDINGLEQIFKENKIDCVIHFAGLKAVGESVAQPLKYFNNNITGTINLLMAMQKYNCKKIIFSSSATVYGTTQIMPLTENSPLGVTNPYGRTKLVIEDMLKDLANADNEFCIILLRYFNPIGANQSNLIGENPNGIPNNLMPYICKVAKGELPELNVFGNDYDTVDGTGVRDYIHVEDLAIGHVKAYNKIKSNNGLHIYNLGTGNGYSVLQVISSFEKANNIKINYNIAPRRTGDVATVYADTKKAEVELDFKAKYGIEEMCRDSWNFYRNI